MNNQGVIAWLVFYACARWQEMGDVFVGVFSSEEKAREACVTSNHFVYPATVDAVVEGDYCRDLPGAYFPLEEPSGK